MTKEQTLQKLVECQNNTDYEAAHVEANRALCEFLKALGHADVAAEFLKVTRYCA